MIIKTYTKIINDKSRDEQNTGSKVSCAPKTLPESTIDCD